MEFENQQHGSYELSTEGNVIIANIYGSWNEETARVYSNELKQMAVALDAPAWGHLADLEEWGLGTDEMIKVIEELAQWCIKNGVKRAAHVYSDSVLKKLQLDGIVAESQGDFQRQSFSDKHEALRWLAEQGYSPG